MIIYIYIERERYISYSPFTFQPITDFNGHKLSKLVHCFYNDDIVSEYKAILVNFQTLEGVTQNRNDNKIQVRDLFFVNLIRLIFQHPNKIQGKKIINHR